MMFLILTADGQALDRARSAHELLRKLSRYEERGVEVVVV